MASPWNEQLEKLLLFSMIEDPDNVSRVKFETAAEKLGGTLSWNACRSVYLLFFSPSVTLACRSSFDPFHPTHLFVSSLSPCSVNRCTLIQHAVVRT